MNTIKAIYRAGYTDYDGLDTYRVMPTRNVPIDLLEPFIFLNHHGPQQYQPGNKGLPFGPHPHKGFETVTFIIDGELVHQDSTGFNSNIRAGGIQWMTAGKGIIHSETSSDVFKANGGTVEILQLWVNLPAQFKNIPPAYIGLQQPEVPAFTEDNGKVTVNLVSGFWGTEKAPIQSLSGVQLCTISLLQGGKISVEIPNDRSVLFYVVKGKVMVNQEEAEAHDLVEFERDGGTFTINAAENSLVVYGNAKPLREPVIAHGPFVMNTQEEIRQAFVDYQEGKFGVWSH